MNALRRFPKMVVVGGIALALAGMIVAGGGIYLRTFVGQQLAAQQITTPEDASIPNAPVTGIATALSMADSIQHHAADSANGLTYAQMGHLAVASGDHTRRTRPPIATHLRVVIAAGLWLRNHHLPSSCVLDPAGIAGLS